MKNLILALLSLVFANEALSQKEIEVSFDKSVIIIYGNSNDAGNNVKAFTVGRKESIGAKSMGNKLVLQALEDGFLETNIFVELSNGKYFNYLLKYNNNPKRLVHEELNDVAQSMAQRNDASQPAVQNQWGAVFVAQRTENKPVTPDNMQRNLHALISGKERDFIYDVAEISHRMKVWCGGIYVTDERKYIYKVSIENNSNADYEIGVVDVKVTDKGKALRSKVKSEVSLEQHVNNAGIVVPGNNKKEIYVVTDQVTVEANKKLLITLWEKYPGSRNFSLELENTHLVGVRRL